MGVRVNEQLVSELELIVLRIINVYAFLIKQDINTEISHYLADSPILPMSNIYIISKSLHDEFSYQKVYRTAHTEPLIFEKYGTFKSDRFDNVGRTELRQNLYGYRLRSKTILAHNDSINVYQSYANKVVDTFPKAHLLMAMDLISMLNATVRMVVVPGFGLFNLAAGTSYGIPLDIITGQLDFSATGYLYRADRVAYIEYVIAPVQTYAAFYYRTPSLSYTDNLFVLPFDELVWACFLVLIVLMVALLTGIMFCEWHVPLVPADEGAQADEQSDLLRVSIYDSFVLIFGATCQQGSAVTPRCNSARLFMIVSFIALMFLFTSYSANIVALLQSPSDKIRTLQDMLDSPLEMGVDTSPYVDTYFPVRARARWTRENTAHFALPVAVSNRCQKDALRDEDQAARRQTVRARRGRKENARGIFRHSLGARGCHAVGQRYVFRAREVFDSQGVVRRRIGAHDHNAEELIVL